MLIAFATGRDSFPLFTRRLAVSPTAPRVRSRIAFGVAWVGLALTVWRERRALARLTESARRDIGLHAGTVAQEVGRSVFDLPRARVESLHRPECDHGVR